MKRDRVALRISVMGSVLLVATLLLNYLSDMFKLGGYTNKEISDMYPTLFTPDKITFSIWGIIYLGLIIFAVFSFRKGNKDNVKDIGVYYILSFVLNMAWIILWHFNKVGVSLGIIILLMVTLYIITNRLDEDKDIMGKSIFGLYTGWITIATAANMFVSLSTITPKFHESTLEILLVLFTMIIVTMVTWFMVTIKENPFYGVAVIWGEVGVVMNQFKAFSGEHQAIIIGGILSILIIALGIIIALTHSGRNVQGELNS